jgi:hypothetical protein
MLMSFSEPSRAAQVQSVADSSYKYSGIVQVSKPLGIDNTSSEVGTNVCHLDSGDLQLPICNHVDIITKPL